MAPAAWRSNSETGKSWKTATRIDNLLSKRRFAQAGFLDEIEAAVRRNAAFGAYTPSYGELWNLFRLVIERRPTVMIEFGSGYSTLALAEAFRRNAIPDSRFYSVEGIADWAERTRSNLSAEHLQYCEVMVSAVDGTEVDGAAACVHRDLPDAVPDMVYLDGPMLKNNPEWLGAVDLLAMEDRLPPDFFLIVDGRERNAKFLHSHFRRPFDYWEERGLFGRAYRQRCFRFTG